jgi:DNA invertase Pin-like site-specific DNA recombinase
MRVAIYARVSTDAQEARGTIGSQLETLRERVAAEGQELVASYVDDGFSGARLDRPGLDGLRDAAEAGEIEALWCLTPDRLSRSYAYQVLIADELARHGVAIRYLDAPDIASDPQARLLTQVQSVIAEYERAKISERSRRGKLYRARAGEAVHWRAPFGYAPGPQRGAGRTGAAHLRRLHHRRDVAEPDRAAPQRRGRPHAGGQALDHLDPGAPAQARGLRGTGVGEHHQDGRRPGPGTAAPSGPPAPKRVDRRALPPHRRGCHLRGGGGGEPRQHQLLRPPPRPQRAVLAPARPGVLRLRDPLHRRPQRRDPLLRLPQPQRAEHPGAAVLRGQRPSRSAGRLRVRRDPGRARHARTPGGRRTGGGRPPPRPRRRPPGRDPAELARRAEEIGQRRSQLEVRRESLSPSASSSAPTTVCAGASTASPAGSPPPSTASTSHSASASSASSSSESTSGAGRSTSSSASPSTTPRVPAQAARHRRLARPRAQCPVKTVCVALVTVTA